MSRHFRILKLLLAIIIAIFGSSYWIYRSITNNQLSIKMSTRHFKTNKTFEKKIYEEDYNNEYLEEPIPIKGQETHIDIVKLYNKVINLQTQSDKTHEIINSENETIQSQMKEINQLKILVTQQNNKMYDTSKKLIEINETLTKLSIKVKFSDNKQILAKHWPNKLRLLPTKPFRGLKIVHLDLKGAPPKIVYLLKFMSEAKNLGANGFLIEYEDMFPWSGELSILAQRNAYSKVKIRKILTAAAKLKMEVIPLIQTFGHLEFVLKHKQFKYLQRQVGDEKSINAANNNSIPLITKMLSQVLELHSDINWFHIGGDEVEGLDTCDGCEQLEMTHNQIFKHHMIPVLKFIKSKQNNVGDFIKPIIWDDMMRRWSSNDIKSITKHATPMVWAYVSDLRTHDSFPHDMWERYIESFPKTVFFASAFKGATLIDTDIVPAINHVQNNVDWLKVVSLFEKLGRNVHGIALTGWSRFMHNFPLCEILPVGTPSLALCLEVLNKGYFDDEIIKNVSTRLGFVKPFVQINHWNKYLSSQQEESNNAKSNFLGADVYRIVNQIENEKMSVDSSDTDQDASKQLLRVYMKIKLNVLRHFHRYFFTDTITEWLKNRIDTHIIRLKRFIRQRTTLPTITVDASFM